MLIGLERAAPASDGVDKAGRDRSRLVEAVDDRRVEEAPAVTLEIEVVPPAGSVRDHGQTLPSPAGDGGGGAAALVRRAIRAGVADADVALSLALTAGATPVVDEADRGMLGLDAPAFGSTWLDAATAAFVGVALDAEDVTLLLGTIGFVTAVDRFAAP